MGKQHNQYWHFKVLLYFCNKGINKESTNLIQIKQKDIIKNVGCHKSQFIARILPNYLNKGILKESRLFEGKKSGWIAYTLPEKEKCNVVLKEFLTEEGKKYFKEFLKTVYYTNIVQSYIVSNVIKEIFDIDLKSEQKRISLKIKEYKKKGLLKGKEIITAKEFINFYYLGALTKNPDLMDIFVNNQNKVKQYVVDMQNFAKQEGYGEYNSITAFHSIIHSVVLRDYLLQENAQRNNDETIRAMFWNYYLEPYRNLKERNEFIAKLNNLHNDIIQNYEKQTENLKKENQILKNQISTEKQNQKVFNTFKEKIIGGKQ